MAKNSVQIIPHDTYRNKTNPDYGVQMIAPNFKFGRVRLPGKASSVGRAISMKLVDEVTRYPQASTDDCVMACWFVMFQMQYLATPVSKSPPRSRRPSWLGKSLSRV
jgi:hypothetical protein